MRSRPRSKASPRARRKPQAADRSSGLDWRALLHEAVHTPGVIAAAYRAFWNYSLGNQLLAWIECKRRSLPPGPIHTFRGWQRLNRFVRKGENAISLVMPVTIKRKRDEKRGASTPVSTEREVITRRIFVLRPNWFVLSQTDGEEYQPVELATWSESTALTLLGITRKSFTLADGNAQGYAYARVVAVSPIAFAPWRTLFHELGHVILGHTDLDGRLVDGESIDRSIREVEAECVAMICCDALGLPGAEHSRGYVQHWLAGREEIPEKSIQRIFHAADVLLRAGRGEQASTSPPSA